MGERIQHSTAGRNTYIKDAIEALDANNQLTGGDLGTLLAFIIQSLEGSSPDYAIPVTDQLESLKSNTDQLEALLTTIDGVLDTIDGNTDGLEALSTTANGLLTTINTALGVIETSILVIEATLLVTNTKLGNIEDYTDGLEGLTTSTNSLLTTIDTVLDAINAKIIASQYGFDAEVNTLLTSAHSSFGDAVPNGTTNQLNSSSVLVSGRSGNSGRSTVAGVLALDSNNHAWMVANGRYNPETSNIEIESHLVTPEEYKRVDLTHATHGRSMNVDGSTTPVPFNYNITAGKDGYLFRSFIALEDGSTAFSPGNFGALGSLTNGLDFKIDGTIIANIKTNRDLALLFYDLTPNFFSSGSYTGRWTHTKDVGVPVLVGAGETIEVIVNDDLTGLNELMWSLSIKEV